MPDLSRIEVLAPSSPPRRIIPSCVSSPSSLGPTSWSVERDASRLSVSVRVTSLFAYLLAELFALRNSSLFLSPPRDRSLADMIRKLSSYVAVATRFNRSCSPARKIANGLFLELALRRRWFVVAYLHPSSFVSKSTSACLSSAGFFFRRGARHGELPARHYRGY